MQLESRSDPTTTGTLVTVPAERAQLRSTLGTRQLKAEGHKREETQLSYACERRSSEESALTDFVKARSSCVPREEEALLPGRPLLLA